MEIKSVSNREATIGMPIDEVRFLADAVNETLNAVSARDFKTRTGVTRERADGIRLQLVDIMKAIVTHEKGAGQS